MGNAMKYVKVLEAAGFERGQAEAQVQVVLDALEGDLVTKGDFAVFQERLENRFVQIDNRFVQIENKFSQLQSNLQNQIRESEFRVVIRLGIVAVSVATIAVAVLTWLIKI